MDLPESASSMGGPGCRLRRPRARARLWLAGLGTVWLSMSLAAWANPPLLVALPNDYHIERTRSGELVLENARGKALISPLAGYAVYGVIVTGLAGPEPHNDGSYANDTPLPESSEPRYFILDTSTGQLQSGLSAQDWKARLKALGTTDAPEIHAVILPSA